MPSRAGVFSETPPSQLSAPSTLVVHTQATRTPWPSTASKINLKQLGVDVFDAPVLHGTPTYFIGDSETLNCGRTMPRYAPFQVNRNTSPRRRELVDIVQKYKVEHPDLDIEVHAGASHLGHEQWQDFLLSSRFTLTPGGHYRETFRIF